MHTETPVQPARLAFGLVLAMALVFSAIGHASAAGTIRYVDVTAWPSGDGSSWAKAFTDLQDALTAAVTGDQIWVASGIYLPTDTDDREVSFALKSGVAIYGGFNGTETLLTKRDPVANPTVLSGDIGDVSYSADNSYHVVSAGGVDNTAILDGFTIAAGNADGTDPFDRGAGMYNTGSPTLRNLVFTGNSAIGNGGGLYTTGAPSLSNVFFMRNTAKQGGGLHSYNSSPVLTNVTFSGNSADNYGGGMFTNLGTPSLTDVIFSGNTAPHGGGLHNRYNGPSLTDVTFTNNEGTDGGGLHNISSSPIMKTVKFLGNAADSGGGMYSESGTPKLTDVFFSGNRAQNGGGMDNEGSSPLLTRVTFSGNFSMSSGGAMYNAGGAPALTDVTFYRNRADSGAGIFNTGSNAILTGVTFEQNSAASDGGGIYNDSSSPTLTNVTMSRNLANYGGGMYDLNSGPLVVNVTFSGNYATHTGGGGGGLWHDSGHSHIYDSIFWADQGGEIKNQAGTNLAIADSIISGGCPSASCTGVLSTDPKLGPLQNNGGFTETMGLTAGSAAIDAGAKNSTCATRDQRGVNRPQGLACDIGAYEVRARAYTSVGISDGWVLESTAISGVGGSLNSTAATLRVGDDPLNRQYRSVLSFNTSSVPDTAIVVAAKLRVKGAAVAGKPFASLGSLRFALNVPYFGTSSALELGDFQAPATVSVAGTVSSIPSNGWYTGVFNLAGRSAVSKTGLTQLRLRFLVESDNDNVADVLSLYSGDATTVADRPVLYVYYNP